MSRKEDRVEVERIAKRNAKIKQLLTEGETKKAARIAPLPVDDEPWKGVDRQEEAASSATAITLNESPSQPASQPTTYYGRRLRPYERVNARGMVEQFRPPTSREREEDEHAEFMRQQRAQDEAHERKVHAAIREAELEQKRRRK